MHIHLYVNGSSLMLSDGYPEHGAPAEKPQGFNLTLQVKDIDKWWQRAVDAGALSLLASLRFLAPIRRGAPTRALLTGFGFGPGRPGWQGEINARVQLGYGFFRQLSMLAARQISRQLEIAQLHLNHAAHFQTAAVE